MTWLTGWNYRKAVTISNTGSTLSDYQVLITIDTASLIPAKMRSDCGDIRFTNDDGSTLLNYWIESGCNTALTKIWIKSTLANGNNTVYMYYGNSGVASASDAASTFIWSDTTGDLNKYNLRGTVTSSGGGIQITFNGWAGNAAISKTSIARPYIVEWTQTQSATNMEGAVFMADVLYPSTVSDFGIYASQASSKWGAHYDGNAYNVDTLQTTSATKMKVVSQPTSGWILYIAGNNVYSNSDAASDLYFTINGYAQSVNVKNVFVRKYASPEPTSALGTEQTPANITATNMSVTPSESPCRVGICTVTVEVTWTNNGGTSGDFIPNITIDGTPYSSPYPLQPLGAGLPVTKTFTVSGLAVGTRNICPYPN